MEATPLVETSEPQPVATPQPVSENLKALLSRARSTRQMLYDFKAAMEDCTVHGSHVVHLALGMNFVHQLINQSSGDIKTIQDKIDSEAKASSSESK